ncbi:MAG: putative diacylglycerol O-acyltransferase [Candidatus Accumulibacter regalis]|jgi:diacylglycerol O-acyltransferase|uniref:diacylglycerol O-acyltransferase n=1 Tax=Accumulibacter regalis TaxID=522306 RepID=A0A011NRN1_ACCRE|nr:MULTISPECIES: wax ester/triacylglycerol synthase family O-acyltransferase [unclassified Candidatus Accumulibacter]EXI85383.1 MAG: putative diacylglycerol O-acyltransferase [Candidatus Accumulibacter regalis]MQM33532.1 wax ester/triacylglycerol synthase family O-acyltransferase [Candidatus Accumulibacter phosphatis]MBN8514693.1 wax ester/triacylglycerol synthase family O-acyltransferase [Accumulibacter sp.]MBO3702307.1 wax ester/triacylglycerol synthase family O-acyltransferase [Accumulibacte
MTVRERVSHVDTAWLRMDRPENLMQIVGVMIFVGRIDAARLKRTLAKRLLRYRRFRQIATLDADGACWVDDADFDIDRHLRHSLLPAPSGKHELQKFVAEMASEPLNPARPRWEFNLVELADGNSALVARIHHAIADGIALIGVMNTLTDERSDAPEDDRQPTQSGANDSGDSDAGNVLWRWALAPLTDVTQGVLSVGGQLWGQYLGLRKQPGAIADYARVAAAIAEEIGRLALLPGDSQTRFKGQPGTVKRVAWSEPASLAEIKACGKLLGCSVNDTLLSCVAGALRGYLVAKGERVENTEIRVMVPVNLRAPDDAETLGNRFGLVALELPIGIANPLARLYAIRARMAALKGSYQALLTFALLGATGMAPSFVEEQVLKVLASKTTAVMTNVPGAQQARYLAGARIDQQMVWVPQAGDIGMGVSVLSYDGRVQFGLLTDKTMVDDPQNIVDRFADEFEKLLWLVLLQPVDRLADPNAVAEDLARSARGPRAAASPQSASSARAASTSRRSIASIGTKSAAS